MTIRKLLRKRKQIMRQFILIHDPRFPKPGQKVMFAYETGAGAEQEIGTYRAKPARIVTKDDMFFEIYVDFKNVIFWAPFRGEGMKKHVKTRKVEK
jgi:hypothetical protein